MDVLGGIVGIVLLLALVWARYGALLEREYRRKK
jgi:hypothetical protein